jgi:[ribosomal protein S5]-alanine N-acetyltransferase
VNLSTARLELTPIQEIDWEILARILNDFSVRQYLCDDRILTENELNEMILTSQLSFQDKKYGLWFIVEKTSREIVGFVGLWHFFAEIQPQLSYGLLPQFTGSGFATEAAKRVIDYSFNELGFQYLTASCDRPNLASQKVLATLGMEELKEEIVDGRHLIIYQITC